MTESESAKLSERYTVSRSSMSGEASMLQDFRLCLRSAGPPSLSPHSHSFETESPEHLTFALPRIYSMRLAMPANLAEQPCSTETPQTINHPQISVGIQIAHR